MNRTTLGDVRDSSIPKILNVCPTDPKVPRAVNEATRRLLNRGRFWGTYEFIQICVEQACLTWPRQVAHVEKLDLCHQSVPMKNGWWETLAWSDGRRPGDGCGQLVHVPRGTSCTFADIIGTNKTLRVYPGHSSDTGKRILFQGTDENGIWIRTQENGGWVDGFWLTLGMPFVDSPMKVRALTSVPHKDQTNALVRLYEHDTTLNTDRALAIYEPTEKTPYYQRSFLDPLCRSCSTVNGSGCSPVRTVTALVKLAFIPVVADTDFLLISNLDALKDMVMSIRKREDNLEGEAIALEKAAIRELNHELRTHTGDTAHVSINVFGSSLWNRVMSGFR